MTARLHRVVVTGVGVISPFGVGSQAFWKDLTTGRNSLTVCETLGAVVGRVPKDVDPSASMSAGQMREMSRATVFVLEAAKEALTQAQLVDAPQELRDDTGVNIGMGIADLESIVDAGRKIFDSQHRKISPYFVPRILTNIPASYVSLKYQLRGGNSSTTTACATGANSIGDAFVAIRHGRIPRIVAGATESCLHPVAVEGFRRMRALATSLTPDVSRPFDASREGFVLSEGAALVVLETLESALDRGAPILGEVLGFGIGNDAHHLTAPRDDGLGSTLAMKRCLADTGLPADAVGYVNAHATSTPVGDKAEAFSVAALRPGVAISSIKGHTGHALAAAGAMETIATLFSVRDGVIVGTKNLQNTDIAADVDLVSSTTIDWRSPDRRVALMNSFGFGGAFTSVAIGEYR